MLTSHAERVVDDQGDAMIMCDLYEATVRAVRRRRLCLLAYLCKFRKRSDVVLGVADALDVDGFCLVVNRGGEFRRVVAVHKLDADVEPLQEHCNPSSDMPN